MSGYEQSWGQNCTEIAPATPYTIELSALLRRAAYTSVDQGLDTRIHCRAIQGVTGTLGVYSDALCAFKSRGFGGEIGLVLILLFNTLLKLSQLAL